MSTMGIAVYNAASNNAATTGGVTGEQLMLLRTLQDNERNIMGNNNNNNSRSPTALAVVKNNVSVINVNTSVSSQQNENEQNVTAVVTATATSGSVTSKKGSNRQNINNNNNNNNNNNVLPPYDPTRLKKHGKNGQPPPIAVAKRNARERNRVKQVNNGFATLRQHIPSHVAQGYGDRGKKLSKVETLRMAVEYIRGLQRLLAEADGVDYDVANARNALSGDSMMIPSPTTSVYSGSTHNGSGEVLGLGGSELDEHQSGETVIMDEDLDSTENFLVQQQQDLQDEDEEDPKEILRDPKRFKADDSVQNGLSENQNRGTVPPRCRRNSPTIYYSANNQPSFGDEENIEPNRNNNNNNNINATNNNVLLAYSPTLLQTASPTSTTLPSIKREVHLMDEDDAACRGSPIIEEPGQNILIASSSPYSGEIYIENQEGRLIPLKIEDPDAQLIYVSASDVDMPTSETTYATYKSEIAAAAASEAAGGNTTEFMDVVSCWWDQDRLVQQLQQQQQQQQQTHHHQVVQHPHHQQMHHQHQHHHHHQQISVPVVQQQRLAHV